MCYSPQIEDFLSRAVQGNTGLYQEAVRAGVQCAQEPEKGQVTRESGKQVGLLQ